MIFLRFFIYGFIFSGVMLYISIPGLLDILLALAGGASFVISLIAALTLGKIYRELLQE